MQKAETKDRIEFGKKFRKKKKKEFELSSLNNSKETV